MYRMSTILSYDPAAYEVYPGAVLTSGPYSKSDYEDILAGRIEYEKSLKRLTVNNSGYTR